MTRDTCLPKKRQKEEIWNEDKGMRKGGDGTEKRGKAREEKDKEEKDKEE